MRLIQRNTTILGYALHLCTNYCITPRKKGVANVTTSAAVAKKPRNLSQPFLNPDVRACLISVSSARKSLTINPSACSDSRNCSNIPCFCANFTTLSSTTAPAIAPIYRFLPSPLLTLCRKKYRIMKRLGSIFKKIVR